MCIEWKDDKRKKKDKDKMCAKTVENKAKGIIFVCIMCMTILTSIGAGLLITLRNKVKNSSVYSQTDTIQLKEQIKSLYVFVMILFCVYILSLFILSRTWIYFGGTLLFLAICLCIMLISFLGLYKKMNIFIDKKGRFVPRENIQDLTSQDRKMLQDAYMCLLLPFWSAVIYLCIVSLYFTKSLIKWAQSFSL